MKLLKRILSLALVLLMTLALLPPQKALAYSSRDLSTALEQFRDCAFSAEYGGNGRDYTVRWEKPIHVYMSGDYTDKDVAFFFRFVMELTQNVPGLPEIRLVNTLEDSNIQMYFAPLDSLHTYISSYTEGNWGYFTFWHSGSGITRAKIAISTDVTDQTQRNHLLMEEFVGVLGLANDHYLDKKSILYGKWTETQKLTDADWLMLSFLYDQRFSAGLTWNEIAPSIEALY